MSNIVETVEGAIKAAETAVAAEATKVEKAAVIDAEQLARDAAAEVDKAKGEITDTIVNIKTALFAFVDALKDEASKTKVIEQLETVVDHLKNPVVDEAAALAARAVQEAAVAAAKELEAQAKEDALAASGWALRTWHKVWAWL